MNASLDPLLIALDEIHTTAAVYDGYVANHSSMVMEALTSLDLPEHTDPWLRNYKPRLEAVRPPQWAITGQSWREALGETARETDWTQFFDRQLAEHSWPEVLRRWWTRLLPGIAACASHGVLRTAHAVRRLSVAGIDPHPLLVAELSRGLALWASKYQQLPGCPTLAGDCDLVTTLRALRSIHTPHDSPVIARRLAALTPSFATIVDTYAPQCPAQQAGLVLDELLGTTAQMVISNPQWPIAVCHTVTAPAAIRWLLPWLTEDQQAAAAAATWHLVAGIVTAFDLRVNMNLIQEVLDSPDPDLQDLRTRAGKTFDEHIVKLTDIGIAEYTRSADPIFLHAANSYEPPPLPGHDARGKTA